MRPTKRSSASAVCDLPPPATCYADVIEAYNRWAEEEKWPVLRLRLGPPERCLELYDPTTQEAVLG